MGTLHILESHLESFATETKFLYFLDEKIAESKVSGVFFDNPEDYKSVRAYCSKEEIPDIVVPEARTQEERGFHIWDHIRSSSGTWIYFTEKKSDELFDILNNQNISTYLTWTI